ncbi:HAD domain-containing protein [Solemya pervernicosa gill symbiont]|uniref:HAD domain-containing protein n=1 Tax=Solemya pervernicosa gill symbiont TaxID=642797 RepID=UPI0015616E26
MILLFLDFDGVTHPRTGSQAFLPTCMTALRNAISNYDIHIVVSSTWRETNRMHELVDYLLPLQKPAVGITPVINDRFLSAVRHHEIIKYLIDTEQQSRRWYTIDDCPGFFPSPSESVYFTNPRTSFNEDDMPNFKKLLKSVWYAQQRFISTNQTPERARS